MKRKTIWTAAVLTVLVAAGIALNWKYSLWGKLTSPVSEKDPASVTVNASVKNSYFENARYTREQSRSKAVTILNSIINDETVDETTRKNALEEVRGYAKITETEAATENVLKAKGFSECVVFLTSDSATVVVAGSELTPQESAQIFDAVMAQTGLPGGSVKIVPYHENE